MLSRTFEWYRVVNAKATSETIEARKAAASDIMSAIDAAEDWSIALDCAAGLVAGFEATYTENSSIVSTLVNAIRNHDSAFPADLSENALELRVIAALALGELLVRSGDQPPSRDSVLLSAVLQSGLGIRPASDEKYLRQMIDELSRSAESVRSSGARSRRRRRLTLHQALVELAKPSAGEPSLKALAGALRTGLENMAEQSAKDREEIDVLWWMFTGTSATTGQQFAKMPSGAAALCCGSEMGDRCLVPPDPSAEGMIRRAYEVGRKASDLGNRTVEAVAADWKDSLPTVLVPTQQDRDVAKACPALFPLSWLCNRLIESDGATGWLHEFEAKTGISKTHSRSPVEWSIQVFRERIALRVHGEVHDDE